MSNEQEAFSHILIYRTPQQAKEASRRVSRFLRGRMLSGELGHGGERAVLNPNDPHSPTWTCSFRTRDVLSYDEIKYLILLVAPEEGSWNMVWKVAGNNA